LLKQRRNSSKRACCSFKDYRLKAGRIVFD
jgi:hypothetical protein